MGSTIDRYKKASASTSGSAAAMDVNSQASILSMRNLTGKSVGNLTLKELKNLENRFEKGINQIGSKKMADADHDQAHQQAALAPPLAEAVVELDALPTFDVMSCYRQVNMLHEAAAAASSSSRHSQQAHEDKTTTALHLGYEMKLN